MYITFAGSLTVLFTFVDVWALAKSAIEFLTFIKE